MSSFDEDMIDHEEVISQPSAQHPGQAFGGLGREPAEGGRGIKINFSLRGGGSMLIQGTK